MKGMYDANAAEEISKTCLDCAVMLRRFITVARIDVSGCGIKKTNRKNNEKRQDNRRNKI